MPNARELAIIFYAIAFLAFFVHKPSTRVAIVSVVKSFFAKKLTVVWLACFLYFLGALLVLHKIGIWDVSLMTGSAFWFVATLVFVGRIIGRNDDAPKLLEFLKLQTVIFFTLTFLMDFYTLPFLWEMVVVPLLAFVACLIAVAENDEKHRGMPVHNFFILLQTGIALFVFSASVYGLVEDYEKLFSMEGLRSYIMVPVLSTLFLPLFYFMSAYTRYDSLFPVYRLYLDKELGWRIKIKTFIRIRFDYKLLDDWRRHANRVFTMSTINSEDDVFSHLDAFLAERKNAAA